MRDDLAAFLAARLDEDEAAAKAAAGPRWFLDSSEDSDQRSIRYTGPSTLRPGTLADYDIADRVDEADAGHIARHDPARVLREVEAGRFILAEYERAEADYGEFDVIRVNHMRRVAKALARIYAGHPDYNTGWGL